MPDLNVVNFNIVCATLGGFITVFGLVSYLLKEKFYLSEAFISTFAGLISSPHATNFIKPLQYANGNQENLETITLYFSRLVLGVQLVLAGVQLPSKYLWTEWKSLSLLLGPGMCAMWISTSLLVWALVPDISFVFALAIGSCVTPTDPILSNSIVKGKFADKNIPRKLQKIIIAESGANDGLGYPFLYLALYLFKYVGDNGINPPGGGGEAMRQWFGETWGYTIILSVAYGAVVGWLAKELLHWAEERHYVDRESFLVFAITLALFIVGTVGLIGSDDVLACFIAGNAFTWDDWFRLETQDDSLQPTIDMLLNVAIFMWYGAVCPWHKFVDNSVIPIYRLIPLGILVLLFRRLPIVLLYHKLDVIHQIEEIRHALFVGFFGPIGVSAVFYIYISREFLLGITPDIGGNKATSPAGETPAAQHLSECIEVVVWFLVVCSIVVHGLSIPLGKLGFYLPRTITTAISSERVSINQSMARTDGNQPDSPEGFFRRRSRSRTTTERILTREFARRRPTTSEVGPAVADLSPTPLFWLPRAVVRAGRHIIADIRRPRDAPSRATDSASNAPAEQTEGDDAAVVKDRQRPSISGPTNPRIIGHAIQSRNRPGAPNPSSSQRDLPPGARSPASPGTPSILVSRPPSPSEARGRTQAERRPNRSILFADESRPTSPSHSPAEMPNRRILFADESRPTSPGRGAKEGGNSPSIRGE